MHLQLGMRLQLGIRLQLGVLRYNDLLYGLGYSWSDMLNMRDGSMALSFENDHANEAQRQLKSELMFLRFRFLR